MLKHSLPKNPTKCILLLESEICILVYTLYCYNF